MTSEDYSTQVWISIYSDIMLFNCHFWSLIIPIHRKSTVWTESHTGLEWHNAE